MSHDPRHRPRRRLPDPGLRHVVRTQSGGTEVSGADDGVWTLARGSYSDYRVLCACRSKRDAERLAARFNATETYEPVQVEWLPVADATVERVEVLTLSENIWDNGSLETCGERVRVEWPFDALYPITPVSWRWVRAPIHHNAGGRLEVTGIDHERVRRVFSDKRAEIIAIDALRMKREVRG